MTELELLRNTIKDLIADDTANLPMQRITGSKIFLNGRISGMKEVLNLVIMMLDESEQYKLDNYIKQVIQNAIDKEMADESIYVTGTGEAAKPDIITNVDNTDNEIKRR